MIPQKLHGYTLYTRCMKGHETITHFASRKDLLNIDVNKRCPVCEDTGIMTITVKGRFKLAELKEYAKAFMEGKIEEED